MEDQERRELWTRTFGAEALETLDPRRSLRPASLDDRPTLAEPAESGADAKPSGADEAPAEAAPGFQGLEEIGRGGMGLVLRGYQRSLGREIALKRLRPERRKPRQVAAFLAEARVTANLDHPNIVPVYELTAGADPALAMKLVRGQAWSEIAGAEGRLEDDLRILLKVCDALAFAHARGVAHLDLKPENVMVGAFNEVLVMDWGLARRFDPASEVAAPLISELGGILGTPSYMAPEQALGEPERVGAATDIYQLGGMLYEILEGRPPHRGRFYEVLLSACRGAPPRFERSDNHELRTICARAMAAKPEDRFSAVAEFIAAIEESLGHRESLALTGAGQRALELALSRAGAAGPLPPEERSRLYAEHAQALAAFRQALELWADNPRARAGLDEAHLALASAALAQGDLGLAEAQIGRCSADSERRRSLTADTARAREVTARAARSTRRLKRGVAVLLATVVLGLALGLAYALETSARIAAQRDDLRRANEEIAAEKARALERERILERALGRMVNETSDLLAPLPGDRVRRTRDVILDSAISGYEELARTRTDDRSGGLGIAEAHAAIADIRQVQGRSDASRARFEKALAALDALPGTPSAETRSLRASILVGAGEAAQAQEDLAASRAALKDAVALYRSLPQTRERRRGLAWALVILSRSFRAMGEARRARELNAEARSIAGEVFEQAPEDLAALRAFVRAISHGASLATEDGRLDDARALVIEWRDRSADFLERRPEDAEAREFQAAALVSLGDIFRQTNQEKDALAEYDRALKIRRAFLAEDPRNVFRRQNLGMLQSRRSTALAILGRVGASQAAFDEASAIFEALAAEDPRSAELGRDLWQTLIKGGTRLLDAGRFAEALARYRRALAIRERVPEESKVHFAYLEDLSTTYGLMGQVLFRMGELDEALEVLREARALVAGLTEDTPATRLIRRRAAVIHARLGDVLEEKGRIDEALECFRESVAIFERATKELPPGHLARHNLNIARGRIAGIHEARGEHAEALVILRALLAEDQGFVDSHPEDFLRQRQLAIAFQRVALTLANLDRTEESERHYGQGVAICRRLVALNPDEARVQRTLTVLLFQQGLMSFQLGRDARAFELCRAAIANHEALSARLPQRGDLAEEVRYFKERLATIEQDLAEEEKRRR